jgi:hypothetical protein
MKLIRRAIYAVIILVVLVVIAVHFGLDRIITSEVQTQASDSLNLKTTLASSKLSLLGGTLNLSDLQVGSPKGYSAPQMFAVGATDVAINYSQLRNDPIHISSITIDKPKLVIEQENGVLNFKKAMDDIPSSGTSTPSAPSTPSNSKPLKLIIDELKLQNPEVVVKGLPGGDVPLSLPSISLANIGTGGDAQNGAAIKDVVMQVISAMAASASNSGALTGEFKAILSANVGAVVGQLGGEAQKRIAAALPGDLGKSLSGLVANPQGLLKDPGKAFQGLLGGNSSTSQPSNDIKDQAVGALQGLLGGKKNK